MPKSRLVDFVIAGAQKSGATTLKQRLSAHSEIGVPRNKKELHVFDRIQNFVAQSVDYPLYHAFFEPLPKDRLLGEATPHYLYWLPAPERMAAYDPTLKLICFAQPDGSGVFTLEHGTADRT